eukprot:266330-Pyramimonas_sp.AAC.1
MKNTDIKLIASAANRSLHAIAADTAHEQQGFVQGRQFPCSALVVGTEARRLRMHTEAKDEKSVFTSMDMAAAFP